GKDASGERMNGQGLSDSSNATGRGRVVNGIAIGVALKNVSAQSDKELMFMTGERVVLLERLSDGLCMGYCEGVVGQFKEVDVDFKESSGSTNTPSFTPTQTITPTKPTNNRSRSSSAASTASDINTKDLESSSSRLSLMAPVALDPSVIERLSLRKPASEDNLKTSPAIVGSSRRRQIFSLPPPPHADNDSATGTASTVPPPTIPPRSSSRQSKAADAHKQSLATKSSNSSIDSLANPNGSSATIIANSLEIKSNDSVPDSQRLSPIPFQQQQRSRKISDGSPGHPLGFMSKFVDTQAMSLPIKSSESRHPFDRDEGHHENDSYLSSVLDDIRSKTSRVFHMMSPNASLYGDHGIKEVDLRVVQIPAVDEQSSPGVSLSTATASSPTVLSEEKVGPLDPEISFAVSEKETTSRPSTTVRGFSGSNSSEKPATGRARSRSFRGGKPPQVSSLSDSSVPDSSESTAPATSQSVFDKLRPWVKPDQHQRQRCISGPAAWNPDSDAEQKVDGPTHFKLPIPVPQHDFQKFLRQRRTSETTILSTISSLSNQQGLSRNRSINWFGMGRRGSAYTGADMRKPHPLGNGIEGGITSPRLSPLADDDDDLDDDSDDDDGDETGQQKSAENSRIYINDYGFIYDLDDEMNQGQDMTGRGSAVGSSSLGSNVSTHSESERKKANRNHKRIRENELKWIHAATNHHADSVKKSTKYKKLVRRGVPSSVRGRVWLFLAKADLYRKPGLFQELCKRGSLPIHEVIERDIHRCYPDHVHFRDGMGGTGQQDLHAILKAYAHYKPSVGYCQGMGRLVGMMLMQMPVEDAFWLLVATIEGYMQDYYTPSLRQLRIDAQVFGRLLKDQDPALADHLEKNDVIPLMYMTQWFMTLYTMSLPWASVLLVWDVFYFDGVKALFRVGLAILHLCREHLLNKCPSSSELLAYILHIPLDILAPKPLLEAALQIRLRRHSVQKLIAVTAESIDGPPPSSAAEAPKSSRKTVQRTTSTATSSSSVSKRSTSSSVTAATTDTQSMTSPKPSSTDTVALTTKTTTNAASSDTTTTTTTATTTETTTDTTATTATAATTISSSSTTTTTTAVTSLPTSSGSSTGLSSFSPLGVFKTRKRALTIHK
ncbi:hypothetical protein BGZ46_008776, partial [Entomortierella lignicola]